MNTIALLLGLIILFSYGIADFLSAQVSSKMHPNTILFYQKLFSVTLFSIGAFVYFGFPSLTIESIAPLVLMGLASYFGLYFFFRALSTGMASVVVPIANSYIVFAAFFAYFLFDEKFTNIKYLAIALVVIGVFLISITEKKISFKKFFQKNNGFIAALITAFFWGSGLTLMKYSQSYVTPFSVIFVSDIIVLALSFFGLIFNSKIKNKFYLIEKRRVSTIALLFFIAFVAINYAMFISGVTLVSVFIASAPLITLILARYFLNERLYKHQYIAIILILSGLILISI